MKNIIFVHALSGSLTISDEGIRWLDGKPGDKWSNEDVAPAENTPSWTREDGENIVIMDWTGEDTGTTASDGGLAKFFSFTKGTAEFLFVLEDGTLVGVRVVDGKMTTHLLKVELGSTLNVWKTEVDHG